jgi:hypothetical protein
MMTNPTGSERRGANVASGAGYLDDRPASAQPRRSTETKASFKTTELIVYVAAVIGVLLASWLVKTTNTHVDYFRADKAWFYIVLLSIGYMVSRGLAKAGSREYYDGS